MEQLIFDNGVREFQVNGHGVLRFNPGDMNVYSRFLDAMDQIQKVEDDLVAKGSALEGGAVDGEAVVRLMREADIEIKKILSGIFGEQNDFDEILGVNVMAPADNGERAITNFMAAIYPIIEEGARACARDQASVIANEVKASRPQRRAPK